MLSNRPEFVVPSLSLSQTFAHKIAHSLRDLALELLNEAGACTRQVEAQDLSSTVCLECSNANLAVIVEVDLLDGALTDEGID